MLGGEVGKVYHTLTRLSSNGHIKISGLRLAIKAKVKYACVYMHLQRLKRKGFLTWTTGTGGDFSVYHLKRMKEFVARGMKAQRAVDRILKDHQRKQAEPKKTARRAARRRGF